MGETRSGTKIECVDCSFSAIVPPDGDRLPSDVLVEHGEETGHTLTVDTDEE